MSVVVTLDDAPRSESDQIPLPKEIKEYIFSYFDMVTLFKIRCVSKDFMAIASAILIQNKPKYRYYPKDLRFAIEGMKEFKLWSTQYNLDNLDKVYSYGFKKLNVVDISRSNPEKHIKYSETCETSYAKGDIVWLLTKNPEKDGTYNSLFIKQGNIWKTSSVQLYQHYVALKNEDLFRGRFTNISHLIIYHTSNAQVIRHLLEINCGTLEYLEINDYGGDIIQNLDGSRIKKIKINSKIIPFDENSYMESLEEFSSKKVLEKLPFCNNWNKMKSLRRYQYWSKIEYSFLVKHILYFENGIHEEIDTIIMTDIVYNIDLLKKCRRLKINFNTFAYDNQLSQFIKIIFHLDLDNISALDIISNSLYDWDTIIGIVDAKYKKNLKRISIKLSKHPINTTFFGNILIEDYHIFRSDNDHKLIYIRKDQFMT